MFKQGATAAVVVLQRCSLKQPVSSAHRVDAAVLRKPCDRKPFIQHYLARLHHYQSNHADRSGVSAHTNPSSLARYTKWILQTVGLKKKTKKESAWVEPYSQGASSLGFSYIVTVKPIREWICCVLTKHCQVDHVLAVACRKGGVFADIRGFVWQLQAGEHDGGVLQRRRAVANGRLLEADPLFEGRKDRHSEGRVGDGHILFGAVEELLPGHLRDLDWWVTVDEDAAEFHLWTHKSRLTGVHLDHLSLTAYKITDKKKIQLSFWEQCNNLHTNAQ